MITVALIGTGNVAQHLAAALTASRQTELIQVYSRRKNAIIVSGSTQIIDDFNHLAPADLYIIAVSDNAVAAVSEQLPFVGRLVVHTSGALPLSILDHKNRRGVFYPLQTFSKSKPVDFRQVPVCLEAESKPDHDLLRRVAMSISQSSHDIDSIQRKSLHLAAVFVSNFANHMYALGNHICDDAGIPFDILKPLIAETADKVNAMAPKLAQTGPAIRHDDITISAHAELLADENLRKIYLTLTESIQQYGKKL